MVNETNQSPYQWAKNRDGYPVLLRTKHPRLAIEDRTRWTASSWPMRFARLRSLY